MVLPAALPATAVTAMRIFKPMYDTRHIWIPFLSELFDHCLLEGIDVNGAKGVLFENLDLYGKNIYKQLFGSKETPICLLKVCLDLGRYFFKAEDNDEQVNSLVKDFCIKKFNQMKKERPTGKWKSWIKFLFPTREHDTIRMEKVHSLSWEKELSILMDGGDADDIDEDDIDVDFYGADEAVHCQNLYQLQP